MKREKLLTALALGIALVPIYAGAESAATSSASGGTSMTTEAQVFTACSQAAIEVRDNSIGVARTTYNTAMAAALSARKEAEKDAVALADPDEKKDAIRTVVEEYKKAVTGAQDILTKSRKEAWNTFEMNTNKCREASKETKKGFMMDKSASSTEKATPAGDTEETKTENKSLRESILESLKNFFKKGVESN